MQTLQESLQSTTDEEFVKNLMEVIANTSVYTETAAEICEKGILKDVVDCMSRYPKNVYIQMPGCLCLSIAYFVGEEQGSSSSSSSSSAKLLVEGHGIRAVVRALQEHCSNPMVENALKALSSMALRNRECVVQQEGAVKAVLAAMTAQPGNENVQLRACTLLRDFCGHIGAQTTCQRVEHLPEVVDAVLAAMRKFPCSQRLQDTSRKVLGMTLPLGEKHRDRLAELQAEVVAVPGSFTFSIRRF